PARGADHAHPHTVPAAVAGTAQQVATLLDSERRALQLDGANREAELIARNHVRTHPRQPQAGDASGRGPAVDPNVPQPIAFEAGALERALHVVEREVSDPRGIVLAHVVLARNQVGILGARPDVGGTLGAAA